VAVSNIAGNAEEADFLIQNTGILQNALYTLI
jgi:hypothetical protein